MTRSTPATPVPPTPIQTPEGSIPAPPSSARLRKVRPLKGAPKRTLYLRDLKSEFNRRLFPEASERQLPMLRGDCVEGIRPCPFASCRHHLYADVDPAKGSLTLNFPDLEVNEIPATCALDVADEGGMTLDEVGDVMNISHERVRQIENVAMEKVFACMPSFGEDLER